VAVAGCGRGDLSDSGSSVNRAPSDMRPIVPVPSPARAFFLTDLASLD
jgi:hypothetical protein